MNQEMRHQRHAALHRQRARVNPWLAHHRMPARLRTAVYVVLGVLWLSGCLWLCLDQFFASRGQFGATPHPWQPPILMLHGIVSILTMYLLGWITARHILQWWPRRLRRWSGGVLAAFLALLAVSGFALFFLSDDRWQHIAALTHDALGLGSTVTGIQHGFFARRAEIGRGK